jgi:RimJ/RimL family protein N-acetyltransferase
MLARSIGEVMSKNNKPGIEIISKGDLVMLRSHMESDRVHYNRWQTQGEWLQFDAPWEESANEEKQDQDKKKKRTEPQNDDGPQKRAIIATIANKPLGWVNRYGQGDNPFVWFIGIVICEDTYLERGYGSEALKFWVDYLFANSEIHKLCLDTWSFNPRMVRVAEKIGFLHEGSQREMRFWQGEWLDLEHFGILREEWERMRQGHL